MRHIHPADKLIVGKAWTLLSERSQRRRFLSPKPYLTPSELRYLRAFVAVVDEGTFTDAAIALGTTQASVSA